jgi:hypothetical protein
MGILRQSAIWQLAGVGTLALAVLPLIAQQAPEIPSSSPAPGAGAQVRTGASSGLDTEARLRNLLADHQFSALAAQLRELPAADAQFYRGILANRNNDPAASVKLLEPLIDQVAASGDKPKEKILRKALAEDYMRLGEWKQAAAAYQALDSRLGDQLSSDERDEIEQPLKLLPMAAANPPMTVEPCAPFILNVRKDPLGLYDLPVFVDASPHSWMLDPTAPFNLIARSLAREVGIKVGEETAVIKTLTGRPIRMHMAVVPRFTIGGRLTLRNMTVFVFDDQDYFFPHTRYQVQGVLGYAALSALGSLTFTDNGTIEVQPVLQPTAEEAEKIAAAQAAAEEAARPVVKAALSGFTPTANQDAEAKPAPPPPAPVVAGHSLAEILVRKSGEEIESQTGAPFYLDGDQIIVALGKAGDERYYGIDAGSQQTYLTSRYYFEHANDFEGREAQLFAVPGAETAPPQPAYIADSVALPVGQNTVHVHFLQVLTQPLNNAAADDLYGELGIDALDQLSSYTFDYRTMRFSVKPE